MMRVSSVSSCQISAGTSRSMATMSVTFVATASCVARAQHCIAKSRNAMRTSSVAIRIASVPPFSSLEKSRTLCVIRPRLVHARVMLSR